MKKMDLDYRKTSAELVFDLINRDNPQLPYKLTPDNCRLGVPAAITGQGIRNTQISVMPKAGSGYMATTVLTYRRMSSDVLFQQGVPIIDDYATPSDMNGAAIKVESAMRWINQKYGTNFIASDADRAVVTAALGTAYIWGFPATNPAWIGSFRWNRKATKKPVSEQVPATTPALLTLVSGVAPGGNPDNLADFMTYGADFSKFSALLQTLTTLRVLPATAMAKDLVGYMSLVSGRKLNAYVDAATKFGMQDARCIKYALPNVNVPEANSTDYNNVVVITPPAAGGWFVGKFLLHYKV